jgi:SEC-C motif domain protein
MLRAMDESPCPCGGAARYRDCCGRWHAGAQQLQAPDAEALMRSRYTACVLGLHDYLRATWAEETRPPEIAADPPGLRWLGLEVKRHQRIDDGHATRGVRRAQQARRPRPSAARTQPLRAP